MTSTFSYFLAPLLILIAIWVSLTLLSRTRNVPNRVAVLVLGDIGRSPRMQNHAVCLAKAGWNVDLIGFRGNFSTHKPLTLGAEVFTDVLDLKDKITLRYLPSTPKFLTRGGKALFVVFGPIKVLFQIFSLFQTLLFIPRFSYILVQVFLHNCKLI